MDFLDARLSWRLTQPARRMMDHQVISASAGSGKTFALSSRYLMLLSRQVAPSSVLATTFTRKAAGEILDRILLRLAQGAQYPQNAQRLAQELDEPTLTLARQQAMLHALAQAIHRLAIGTMDSFFNRIAQTFRHELGLPLTPRLVDESDPIVDQIRRQAIEAILADDVPQALVTLLRQVHHDLAVQSVTRSLESLLGELHEVYRQASDPGLWQALEVPPGQLEPEPLGQAIERFGQMQPHLPKTKKGSANSHFASAWSRALQQAHRRSWNDWLANGLIQSIANEQGTFSKAPIESVWFEVTQPLIAHARAAVARQINQRQLAAHELLKRYDRHERRLRQQAGIMLFSDLTTLLADQLPMNDPALLSDIYYRLDAGVQHLMLDEFQDTALKQWQVIGPMAQEIVSHGQSSESGRTFFCVGDPKQSIYGWRGGCPELLDRLPDELMLPASARQTMNRSWRSSPVVLETVNRVFQKLPQWPDLKTEDQEAVQRFDASFQPHLAMKRLPGYVCVTTSSLPPATDPPLMADELPDDLPVQRPVVDSPARKAAHEQSIAQAVRRIQQQAPGRSIAILVNRNDTIRRLIDQLRRSGLNASGEGGSLLTDDPAVEAVLAAITLADHPGDRVARFHVTRSPLVRHVAELAGLNSSDDPLSAIAAMRDLRGRLSRQGYAATIARWTQHLTDDCDARSRRRLTQLVELADRYDARRTLRPGDFVRFVQASLVEEPMPALIRVMTVHKAKGLEFDVVVLPSLHEEFRSEARVYLDRPSETEPVRRVVLSVDAELREHFPSLERAYLQQQQRLRRDDLGALYVAMTRARYALHLILPPLVAKKDGSLGVGAGRTRHCPAMLMRWALRDERISETADGGQMLYEAGDPGWAEKLPAPALQAEIANDTAFAGPPGRLVWASTSGSPGRWSRQITPSSLENQGLIHVSDLLNLTPHQGREHGRLIHLWLSRIDWLTPDVLKQLETPGPPGDWLSAARGATGPLSEAELLAKFQWLRQRLNQPAIARLLAAPNRPVTLWRERPFAVRYQNQLIAGTFDRVTIEYEQQQATAATLIDFKTDRLDENDPATLLAAVERYRPQVQAYGQALMGMLGLSPSAITAKLCFLSIDRVVDLPVV